MAETGREGRWLVWTGFSGLSLAILMGQLIPLPPGPHWFAGPDLFLALTLALVVRRPDYAPLSLVLIFALLADLVLYRPPGLWAALVVIGVEILRSRADAIREAGPALELVFITLICIGITMGYRMLLTVFLVPVPPLIPDVMQLGMTLLVYPVVAFTCYLGLRPRRRVGPDGESI